MISATAVKDRLKNYATKNGKNMQEVLTAYGLERTIYRISRGIIYDKSLISSYSRKYY